jgi:hypothetical protein
MRRLFPDNNFVPPKMGPSLRLAVAEAPGAEEAAAGEPLVGGSGRIFDSLCRKAGVRRDDITIINTVNCRPPENKYPTDASARIYCTEGEGQEIVQHCIRAHVLPLLKSRPWTRIDLIGGKALYWLTGLLSVMKWRGSILEVDTDDIEKRVL